MKDLVKKAQNGDKDAFVELIEQNKLALTRAAKAIVHNDNDIADAMQDTVLTAFTKLYTLKQPKYFKTWITRILIHNCFAILKKQRRTIPVEHITEYGYEDNRDTSLDVQSILDTLPENDRLILTLYYLDDISVKDISKLLNLKENTVKSKLSRGRAKFSKIYKSREGNSDEVHRESYCKT